MLRYILLTLLFIWLFRFVMRFVLPALRITSDVRKQMRNMQNGSPYGQGGHYQQNPSAAPRPSKKKEGDYIEYEELK